MVCWGRTSFNITCVANKAQSPGSPSDLMNQHLWSLEGMGWEHRTRCIFMKHKDAICKGKALNIVLKVLNSVIKIGK